MSRGENESSRAKVFDWGNLKYGCVIEEDKPEDHPCFEWKTFYQKEMPGEVEEAIEKLESERSWNDQVY